MTIGEHILFGKYRLCRKLGSGLSGTVYLAFHMELEEYRAVKIVPKTVSGYETFRKEALFLKELRHPGIPVVHDVEEDENNSYLIEEYLEGESLYALVKRLGGLSEDMAVDFGIQICRLVQFMYSAENPILHLDLQPKNLLVCGQTVRLTDFDHACHASDARHAGKRYGTAGFAAPELRSGEALDCRTDIYAIGALLFYMCTGCIPEETPGNAGIMPERKLGRVIRSCMAADKTMRYPSAGALLEELEDLRTEWRGPAVQSQIIRFAGVRHGIGTTHAAIGLSGFLTAYRHPALYREAHDSDMVRKFAKNFGAVPDRAGNFRMGSVDFRPYYGKSVQMTCPYYPFIVEDMGTDWKTAAARTEEPDFMVLVSTGKWWEIDETVHAVRELFPVCRPVLLFNHMDQTFHLRLPEDLKSLPAVYLPFFPNPLEGKPAESCYREIMKAGTGERGKWENTAEKKKRRKISREPSASRESGKASEPRTWR